MELSSEEWKEVGMSHFVSGLGLRERGVHSCLLSSCFRPFILCVFFYFLFFWSFFFSFFFLFCKFRYQALGTGY